MTNVQITENSKDSNDLSFELDESIERRKEELKIRKEEPNKGEFHV